MFTFIGAACGMLAGSLIVMSMGAVLTLSVGVTVGAPIVATGMLAFNTFGVAVAPFFGMDMELIEWAGK